jgi:hypothetical protein
MQVYVLVIIDIYDSITVRVSEDEELLKKYQKSAIDIYGHQIDRSVIKKRTVETAQEEMRILNELFDS